MSGEISKKRSLPPLNGLVLAGGQSVRMGRDKGLIDWHGKPQRYYVADVLASLCDEVFISCRQDQADDIKQGGYRPLLDSAKAKGQFGAILSALSAYPNTAWLVVACDLPLIDQKALLNLIRRRDTSKLATAYRDPETGLPEPLAAIWEPAAQAMLLEKFNDGIDCPRKALIRSEGQTLLVDPINAASVMNVNTPEAARTAKELIFNHAR